MHKYGDIYLLRSKKDNTAYVGVTVDLSKRISQHNRGINLRNHHSYKLNKYCELNKMSSSDFYFSIIAKSIPYVRLGHYEQIWIRYYDSKNNGFNTINGGKQGGGTFGDLHHTSKLNSKNVIEITSMYLTGNYTGQQLADEFGVSRSSIKDILTGKTWKSVVSKDILADIKKIAKQQQIRNGAKEMYRGETPFSYNGVFYKSQSEYTRITGKHIGYKLKKGYKSDEDMIRKNKIISVLVDDKHFNSVSECAEYFGVVKQTVFNWFKSGKAQYVD